MNTSWKCICYRHRCCFFPQVTFALWWLYVYGCDNDLSIWEFKCILWRCNFKMKHTHFIMNCWRSNNGCSWHRNLFHEPWRGGVSLVNVWAQVKKKIWSAFMRQFETLRSAPNIELLGSIINLSVELASEVVSIHPKCNKFIYTFLVGRGYIFALKLSVSFLTELKLIFVNSLSAKIFVMNESDTKCYPKTHNLLNALFLRLL